MSRPGHAAIALVIGYDVRKGKEFSDVSRSDTVMLIRADPVTNTISLLSIPRDLGVPIYCPKNGNASLGVEKINQAYADCEAPGTVDTVRHLSGLPINYLITVNFHGFQEIVDKIGGIWLDVDRRYYHVNNGTEAENYSNINLQPGYQLLNGAQALSFVRYRHTDDDYHRIARQQEFVRALKQQFARNMSFGQLLSSVPILTKNVEVGGKISDQAVLNWLVFAVGLPGGHFFQDKIEGVTGDSQTSTSTANLQQAFNSFTHPDVAVSKAANAAALNLKIKKKTSAPPASKTTVPRAERQRCRGLGGERLEPARAARLPHRPAAREPFAERPDAGVLPHPDLLRQAPEGVGGRGELGRQAVRSLRRPSAAQGSEAARARPGRDGHGRRGGDLPRSARDSAAPDAGPVARGAERPQRSVGRARPAEPDQAPGAVHARESRRCSRRARTPTTSTATRPRRLYWIDKKHHQKAVRLVFKTGAGEYWGIEETNMPNPPVLADKSFQRAIKGREFQLYYSGSKLQMVVLRVHDKSYWVVNTLLDSLSNETMLAIAKGLKPLPSGK